MDGIKIQVTGNIAKVTEKPKRIIAGTIGLPVEFYFDETWDDIVKTAVFVAGENVSRLDEIDGKTTVPWEVLQKPGPWLSIGVYGESIDGEKTIPTTWANVSPILFGTSLSGDPTDPSAAPIWKKLKDEMENVRDLVEEGYISNASINKNGELELTFLDGSVVNVGKVVGETPAIADDLYTKDSDMALSANMGAALREKIDTDLLGVQKELQAEIKQRVKTVNGVAPDESGNVNVDGVSAEEKELILSLFKNTAYTADMSATISRLESLWSGSGDEPDEPVEPDIPDEPGVITHNVTKKLDGVSASNSATAVVNGASYVCNLTAHDGYTLDGAEVSVAMGGKDITSTAYSNGVINIASVTGDVDITVVAREILIYSVTNNLTGVTNSNAQTEATEGDSYSAILTIVEGYTLNSLVITMGGVDITDTAFGDGYINIFEVTGDIVITAIAEAPSAFYELPSPLTFDGSEGQMYDTGVTDLYDVDDTKSFTLLIDFESTNDSWNDLCIFECGNFYMRITPASGRNRFYWRSNVKDISLTKKEKLAITHKAGEPYSITIHYLKDGVYTSEILTAHSSSVISTGSMCIGYHSNLGGAFVGNVNDLKLYHDVIPEADILAYLGVE